MHSTRSVLLIGVMALAFIGCKENDGGEQVDLDEYLEAAPAFDGEVGRWTRHAHP